MANKIGIVLALDGEKEFSQGLKTASSAAKEAKSKLKELDTEYSGSANTIEALRAKQEALTEAQSKYSDKVNAAQSGLDHANTTLEKSKQRYNELKTEVDNAKKAMQDMESAGKTGSSAYSEQAEQVKKLEQALSDQGNECSKAQQKVNDYGAKLNTAQSELNQMNSAVSQNDKYLDEAKSSTDGCATSIDKYGKEVKDATTVTTTWGDKLKQAFANAAVTAGMKALREGVKELQKAFKEMVEVGSEFEASMSYVSAVSGTTGSELDTLSEKAQELGSSTKFTASEVSDAFGYMALAGWDTEQMLDGISGVLDLAAASGMELADASDMVTDYLSAFNMEASQAAEVADMLSFAQANSNTTAEELGEAYGNCAASLNACGQDIETVTAMLEAMANQGEKGSSAGTALNAVMRDISNNMEDGAISIGDATVAVADQQGNFRDLTDIIADVEKATNGLGTAEKRSALSTTFTSRSISAMSLILNEGSDSISEYEDALRSADGAAADMADTMQDNLQGDMTKMNSALEGLGIAAYDYFSGPLRSVVEGVTDIISKVTDAITPQQTIITEQASSVKEMVDDIKSANEDLNSVTEATQSAMDDAVTSSEKIALLGDQLESLNGIEDKTVTQKDRMREVVDELSESIPILSAAFDEEQGKVKLTNDAIEKLVQSSADLEKVNIWTDALADEYKALADAELAYTKASNNTKKLQDEADLWSDISDAVYDYQMSIPPILTSEEQQAQAAQGLAEIQTMLDDAFMNGIISESEYETAMSSMTDIMDQNSIGYYEAAIAIGEYADDMVGVYVPGAEEAAEETEELKEALDESQESYDASKESLEQLTEAQKQEAAAADGAVIKSQTVVNMTDKLGDSVEDASEKNYALAESNNALTDSLSLGVPAANGDMRALEQLGEGTAELIGVEKEAIDVGEEYYYIDGEIAGSLDELKESTISAEEAQTEIEDEFGDSIGTMGDYAAAIDDAADANGDLEDSTESVMGAIHALHDSLEEVRLTEEEFTKAMSTSYDDAFSAVMEGYESLRESVASGINIDFRTTFNGGADETVESMLATAEENNEALRNYQANMEEVTSHLGDEIGPEFLEYLISLGTDGANTLEHISRTFQQDNGSELISQWNQEFLDSLELQDEITDAMTRTQFALQGGLDDLGSTDAEWDSLHESLETAEQLVVDSGDSMRHGLVDSFEEACAAAQETGVGIPDGLAEGLEDGSVSIPQATDLINEALQGAFDAYAELAEESGVEVSDSLAEGAESGGQAAADAINTLIDEMTEAVSNGEAQIETATDEAVSSGVDGAGEGAGDDTGSSVVENIAESIESNADVVTEAVESVIEEAAETAADSTDQFTEAGEQIGEAIAEGLENSSEAMQSAIESALQEVTDAADDIDVSGFKSVGEKAAEEFGNGLSSKTSADAGDKLAQAVIDALNERTKDFVGPGSEAWSAYLDGVKGTDEVTASYADTLAQTVIDAMNDKTKDFEGPGSEGWSAYLDGIKGTDEVTATSGEDLAQKVIDALNAQAGSFETPGSTSSGNYVSGIASQASAASSAATSCASAALSAVQGYTGNFQLAGSNMMAGLAQGISNGGSAAITAAANVASQALAASKAALEISSPSKKYEKEVGLMSDEGMAKGIQEGAGEVKNAATDMAMSALYAAEDALEIESPSKKFRKAVGRQISSGTAFGIKDNQSLAEDAADSLSESVYEKATKWLKKYKKDHDVSAADEKYYWKTVAKHCKEGTEAYSEAIAKLSKASTSKLDDNGEKKSTEQYYSDIYSYAEDYLNKRETLNSWSLQEEMNYWTAVQKELKKGTDAWYEAQQQINSLASSMGSIDNDALSNAEKTLSNIKVMNDLSTEEEISYWETVRSSLTKYSDAWYEVTGTINDLKAEAAAAVEDSYAEIIDAANDYVDKQTALDNMSVNEQLAYWEQIQKEVKKGSDAWYDAQNKINSIKSKIGTVSNMNSLLSAYTTYYDVSEKAEMQYWDAVRKQYQEGTDERLEADQKYFEAKEEYNDKLKDLEDDYLAKVESVNKQLESDIKSLTDSYNSELESRVNELKNAYSLFDEFTSESATGQELLYNIQTQAAGYEAWSDALDTLEERGILSDELLSDLTDMGPEEIAAIYALLDLTDDELTAYQEAFDRKMNAVQKQAEEDTADLLAETEKQTAELKAQAEKDLAELKSTYDADVASVNTSISTELKTLANNTKNIAEDQTAEIVGAINQGTDALNDYLKSVSESNSKAASAASSTASSATTSSSSSSTSSSSSSGTSASDISKILELINAGDSKTSLTAKQRENHSSLYVYLVDNYQRALSTAKERKLAEQLGVDTSQSGWKKKTLTALNKKGFAQGGRVDDEDFAWMDEELDSIGPEMVVSRSDNALLTRLPRGSEIIDANSTDNLLRLAKMNPDDLVTTMAKQQNAIMETVSGMSTGSELTKLADMSVGQMGPSFSTATMEDLLCEMEDLLEEYMPMIGEPRQIGFNKDQMVEQLADGMSNNFAMRSRRMRS